MVVEVVKARYDCHIKNYHNYYHMEGLTDLSKMQEEARARLKPRNQFGFEPQESVIHYHRRDQECSAGKHETFLVDTA